MDNIKDIIYNNALKEYIKKKSQVKINEEISKTYQREVFYSLFKSKLLYNISEKMEIVIHHHDITEYQISKDDVIDIINEIYGLKHYEIKFMKENMPIYYDHLWFESIKIYYYDGGSTFMPSSTVNLYIDIEVMFKFLKFRNTVISIQKKFLKSLYEPPNGVFLSKDYLKKKSIIKEEKE